MNFFISKYNEMSNKSGKKSFIYALNYGLCMDENLRWENQREIMTVHTLLSRPFNFTPVIKNFLSENKKYIVKTVCMSLAKKSII